MKPGAVIRKRLIDGLFQGDPSDVADDMFIKVINNYHGKQYCGG